MDLSERDNPNPRNAPKDGVADGQIANELSREENVDLYFSLDFISLIYVSLLFFG
jgi:hypothetical protein